MNIDWVNIRLRTRSGGASRWPKGARTDDLPWIRHTVDNDIWLITGGEGAMLTSTGEVKLRKGVCLWLRPGVNYQPRQNPARPVSMLYVHFDLLSPDGKVRPSTEPLPPEKLETPNPRLIESLMRRIVDFLPLTDRDSLPPIQQAHVDALATSLAIELDAANVAQPVPIVLGGEVERREVLSTIAQQIDSKPASVPPVPELAATAGYSTTHFNRAFKAQFGLSPIRFIIRARMNLAMHLLTGSSLRIREIAQHVGYRDQFLFHRQFRRYANQTPAQYRRSIVAKLNQNLTPRRPSKGGDDAPRSGVR